MYADDFIDDVMKEISTRSNVFGVTWSDEIEPNRSDCTHIVFFIDGSVAAVSIKTADSLKDFDNPDL